MAAILTLSKRPCRLGNSASDNTEKHGDEDVHTKAFAIKGLMLEADELNTLLIEPKAHGALFVKRDKVLEPVLKQCEPIKLNGKYENCDVTLTLGGLSREEVELNECRLGKFVLTPATGGLTELSLQVLCTPDDDAHRSVFRWLDKEIEAEIVFGSKATEKAKKKQGELAINSFGEGEQAPATH
jgi:hypothetical protein